MTDKGNKSDTRLNQAGHDFERADIKPDLTALKIVTTEEEGKRFAIRTEGQGCGGKLFQAVGGGAAASYPRSRQQGDREIPQKNSSSAKSCSLPDNILILKDFAKVTVKDEFEEFSFGVV